MNATAESVLKEAYFLELRGKALYQEALREGMSPELKELFTFFAKEEEGHAEILKEQLKKLKSGLSIQLPTKPASSDLGSFSVKEIAAAVQAAGYEGALIGAALDFERRAYEFYRDQAETETEPAIQTLYSELADWEKMHMVLFADLDREVREKVWYDNNFWPLD